ncbi:hypothetical protein K492DRAFT_203442 [Lichtheimia hyalospora FSU 10163]|nr:hypothetical protein K492DRAFT_203442 [Lichtheimia hyalospora FSU 10163]
MNEGIPGTPVPSMSTPTFTMTTRHYSLEPRQRRHTIHRPEPILEQVPETHDEEQTFERISGILSTLLQEANNAVNAIEYKQAPRWMQKNDNSDMMIQPLQSISKQISPIDLPSNTNTIQQHSNGCDNDSSSSTTRSSPELSPSSESSTVLSTPTTLDSTPTLLWRKGSATINKITYPMTDSSSAQHRGTLLRGSLVESYKRHDTSMALVDSLSRDLASSDEQDADQNKKQYNDDQDISTLVNDGSLRPMNNEFNSNTTSVDLRLSAFLVVPLLLHIPQTMVFWIFDSLTHRDSSHLTGMLAWCFFFAVANVMVDQAAVLPTTKTKKYSRNVPVPGSYHNKTTGCVSTSLLFRRRNARRGVVIPRRSSIYRKYHHGTTRLASPNIMRDANTMAPCTRTSNMRMRLHRHLHSLTITRSHTQPPAPFDTTLPPPILSPLSCSLSSSLSSSISTITRRNSF